MIEIEIKVHKKNNEKRYTAQIPQTFAEYLQMGNDAQQALNILLNHSDSKAKIKLLQQLLKVPKSIFNAISDADMTALVMSLDAFTLDPSSTPIFKDFTHKNTLFILPNAHFENGTALEFAMADDYFKKATQGDENALLHLVATLCREKEKSKTKAIIAGDTRVPLLSRGEVEHRAQKLTHLDPSVLAVVFLYFAGVKKYIFDLYGASIFAQPEEEETPNEPPSASEEFGWWGIFMELAENPKNINSIHQMNFHELCLWLVRSKIKSDKMRQLFEKPTFKNENQ